MSDGATERPDMPGDQADEPAGRRDVRELAAVPAVGPLHRRAALGLMPLPGRPRRPDALPDEELVVRGITVDHEHLARYNRVCGFRLANTLPATYPHIMAFPLSLQLMTARQFPFPLVGLVHLANRITVHRPIAVDEPLDLAVHAANLRPHERGRQIDLVAVATVDGEVVWQGVSTYLRREGPSGDGRGRGSGDRRGDGRRGDGRSGEARPSPPPASARWRVGRDVGTAYARVSGDHNPIHTSRLGARLLGFRTPIAHGMWSKARCLAALEGRLPETYVVDVSFKRPLPLPSTVAFSATPGVDPATGTAHPGAAQTDGRTAPGWSFALHSASSGRPHLMGEIR